ncbi:beta-ketoacyl synthase [Tribonema minus]|uniref:beta-ketoacyl-[acyl-carrier-protein] synthase I n=1 Tax=Tribonema minus TaxID=303371 RepID=A0A835Z0F5_9STRA|nr:beta-ketoacyl synthase [Tribonema minus]
MRLQLPPPLALVQRRVVVTGLGAVTPLACGMETTWKRLLEGQCGIRKLQPDEKDYPLTHIEQLPTTLAATISRGKGEHAEAEFLFDESKWPSQPRFIQYALQATQEALRAARWSSAADPAAAERAGVAIGTGIGSLEDTMDAHAAALARGPRRISPHFIPRMLLNMAAGAAAQRFALRGPAHCATTACASGAHAVADALRLIAGGEADLMVAGGTEACVNVLSLGGFGKMRALAAGFEAAPAAASRPFDRDRSGFVIGVPRHHLPSIPPQYHLYNLIQRLACAAPRAQRAQPCSSWRSCATRSHAARRRSPSIRKSPLLVSSTKGSTGHLLGAAGALEAAFSVLSLRDGVVPHTLNLENPDPQLGFEYVRGRPAACDLDAVMSNSFGFGGTNLSLIFSRI